MPPERHRAEALHWVRVANRDPARAKVRHHGECQTLGPATRESRDTESQ